MMNKITRLCTCLFVLTAVCGESLYAESASQQPSNTSMLVESEDFQFKGGWSALGAAGSHPAMGAKSMIVRAGLVPATDAMTVIEVPESGMYQLWTRSRDYVEVRQGSRRYLLLVNGQPVEMESGAHGHEGYYWERVGERFLEAGEVVLGLQDVTAHYARSDSILLTTDTQLDPNDSSWEELERLRVMPIDMPYDAPDLLPSRPQYKVEDAAPVAGVLENASLRLKWLQAECYGQAALVPMTEVKRDGQWQVLDDSPDAHQVFYLSSAKPDLTFGGYYPAWNRGKGSSHFTSNGERYDFFTSDDARNPFYSGVLQAAVATACEQVDAHRLEITYRLDNGDEIVGTWELPAAALDFKLSLEGTASEDGYYSFVFCAFSGVEDKEVSAVLVPPMFQYLRIPPSPWVMGSALTPQPFAVVEHKTDSNAVFVAADPESIPLAWGSVEYSPYGFTLRDEMNQVAAVALNPILGSEQSQVEKGESVSAVFRIGVAPGGWQEALTYFSDSIMEVTDYRNQDSVSMTDAAFNIIDFISDAEASGWSEQYKGFYDIEADPAFAVTVAQTSPMALISAAVLARDEELYIERALPSLEYTLSRAGVRWSLMPGTAFNSRPKRLAFGYEGSQFDTAYFVGVEGLLPGNPWLEEVALHDGDVRKTQGFAVNVPEFSQYLAVYQMTGDESWLDKAKQSAQKQLKRDVRSVQKRRDPYSIKPFYNTTFYPSWWNLIDLYEVDEDPAYLEAAQEYAYQTLAGMRSWPKVHDKEQVIHAGDEYNGLNVMWWKGGERYRLGFPRVKGDVNEQRVPEAEVSPVGLGFEQPSTYFNVGSNVKMVYISALAPNMLRLYAHNNNELLKTYARNSTLDRFANYPGYYAVGFTNLPLDPEYPYVGPDVTSIYYHHVPAHLAYTLDYFFTEAVRRSEGAVTLPWGRQQGFVWFSNRVFGQAGGQIFGETVTPWMKRGLVVPSRSEINYISAVSDDKFWVVLINEAHKPIETDLAFGPELALPKGAQVSYYEPGQDEPTQTRALGSDKAVSVQLPAQGLVALSVPIEQSPVASEALPPVVQGIQEVEMDNGLVLTAFRIRSPFGWDSLYTYISSPPVDDLTVEWSMIGDQEALGKTQEYPYEWTYLKLAPGETFSVQATVMQSGEPPVTSKALVFPGVGDESNLKAK